MTPIPVQPPGPRRLRASWAPWTLAGVAAAAVLASFPGSPAAGVEARTPDEVPRYERVSVKDAGTCPGEAPDLLTACTTRSCKGSAHPSVSDDGARVAFASDAEQVVCSSPSIGGFKQVYVRDRSDPAAPRTILVSRGYRHGTPGLGSSDFPTVSADGSVVAFSSRANDLVPQDGGHEDVFVCTLSPDPDLPGVIERVSARPDGRGADGPSSHPVISGDGRWVAYLTRARDLVRAGPARPSGAAHQLVVADRWEPPATRHRWISVGRGSDGSPESADGDCGLPSLSDRPWPRIAYHSAASNLHDEDLCAGSDVFVHDLETGATIPVSVTPDGRLAADGPSRFPSISGDGRWVAFESQASNLTDRRDANRGADVFVRDLETGRTTCVSVAVDVRGASVPTSSGSSFAPELSADGRLVVFSSSAPSLVATTGSRHFQLFAHDRDADGDGVFDEEAPGARRTWPLTFSGPAGPPDQWSGGGPMDLSRDGRIFVFMSEASNLVPSDRNGLPALNPRRCCRQRRWAHPSTVPAHLARCRDEDERPPCEWGRDVFLGRIAR